MSDREHYSSGVMPEPSWGFLIAMGLGTIAAPFLCVATAPVLLGYVVWRERRDTRAAAARSAGSTRERR